MAKTSTVNMQVTVTGDGINEVDYPIAGLQNTTSPASRQWITLASGVNTITIPASPQPVPTGVLIIPPSGGTIALTLGVDTSGNNGIPISASNPSFIAFATVEGATFTLKAGAQVAVLFYWL